MERNMECRAFRELLERALEGRAAPEDLAPLGWDEHLLGCEPCRDLFAREEALEELLATWPGPKLSPERRRALIACLHAHVKAPREHSLDALLEADALIDAPQDLAARVRAGVDDARLDDLLELDRELVAPRGLAARVLDGLEDERAPAPRFRADRRLLWFAAAAAAVALLLQIPRGDVRPDAPDIVEGPDVPAPRDPFEPEARFDGVEVAAAPTSEDDDLLAVLDLLEEDALWETEGIDLDLATEIDIHEEWLLEYALESEGDDADDDDTERDAGGEVR